MPSATEHDDATLRARVSAAEERTLEYWIQAVTASNNGSMTVRAIQSSMSWRVTKPLRMATTVYRRLQEAGPRRTIAAIRAKLAQRREANKRG
jgi:hypothetical protein